MATTKEDTYERVLTAAPLGPTPAFLVWRSSIKWAVAVGPLGRAQAGHELEALWPSHKDSLITPASSLLGL